MKNVFLTLFVLMGMLTSAELSAQTTCTPAQQAACKKVCTPAQVAACQKISATKKTTSATAVKVAQATPAKQANCAPASCNTATAKTPESPIQLVGLKPVPSAHTTCVKKKAVKTKKS